MLMVVLAWVGRWLLVGFLTCVAFFVHDLYNIKYGSGVTYWELEDNSEFVVFIMFLWPIMWVAVVSLLFSIAATRIRTYVEESS